MALIVLMEDDLTTVTLITAVLKKSGHTVLSAENGVDGLALVRLHKPDLIISDVQMPEMGGVQMLKVLRQEAKIATTPVILLTFLDDRSDIRLAMVSGADDYITKPFQFKELLDAVSAQLNRSQLKRQIDQIAVAAAVKSALEFHTEDLAALYEKRLVKELSDRWPSPIDGNGDEVLDEATILYVDIDNYGALAQIMAPDALTQTVKNFFTHSRDTAHLFGASYLQFVGEGLLVIFNDSANTASVTHSLRACRAATGLIGAASRAQTFMRSHFKGEGSPEFSISMALHKGPVSMMRLDDPLHGSHLPLLPMGEAVSTTVLLQRQARLQGWKIAASLVALDGVPGKIKSGAVATLTLPGRTAPLEAIEFFSVAVG